MCAVLRKLACLAFVFVACNESLLAKNVPEWADKRLPKVTGLALWLDASAQPAAAQARGIKQTQNGDAPEYWFDASGFDRHLRQSDAKSRPALRLDKELGVFIFNGRDSSSSLRDLGGSEPERLDAGVDHAVRHDPDAVRLVGHRSRQRQLVPGHTIG